MITSDERRAIAARIGDLLESGKDPWWSDEYKCVMGTSLPGATSRSSDRRAIIRRIRELCEMPDDWYVKRGDEELAAHGLLRAPRDADGRPIRLGDMLGTTRGGAEVGEVTHIEYQEGAVMVTIGFEGDSSATDLACHFRHHPDTPERVANDLDEIAKHMILVDDGPVRDRLTSLAERLREMGGDAR